MSDYPHPIPAGRINTGEFVFWRHYHASGSTECVGTVDRYYAGSKRYGVVTTKGFRTPLASVLERENPQADRVGLGAEVLRKALATWPPLHNDARMEDDVWDDEEAEAGHPMRDGGSTYTDDGS